jgi:D-alanyl-D-alanine carboxypeptidase
MTKIMTAFTCCQIIYQDMAAINLDPRKIYMRASDYASKMGGTSAYIKVGLRYSLYDLLIGLMLPSGNDAAIVIAENLGRFLIIEKSRNVRITLQEKCE